MSSKGYVDLERGTRGGANKLVTEAFGTFFLALALFGLTTDSVLGALGVGVMLALVTIACGGGHYNPAISFAYTVNDGSKPLSALGMIGAQVGGAALAAIFASKFLDGAAAPGDSDMVTGSVAEGIFVYQLMLTYLASDSGLTIGLSYFSGLLAYGPAAGSTANPAIVLGTAIANVATGNGLSLSTVAMARCAIPLLVATVAPYCKDFFASKVPRGTEFCGAFFLFLGILALQSNGADGANLAIGTTLATWATICGTTASFNPAITVARLVKSGRFDTWADPLFDVCAHIVGAALAAVVGAWALGADAPDVADIGNVTILDLLASLVLVLLCIETSTGALNTGLGYFGLLTAFGAAASSYLNPALPIGSFVGGLLGFGGASSAFPVAPVVAPLAGGALAALLGPRVPAVAKEGVGVFVLYVTVGNGGGVSDTYGALAIGALVIVLTELYGADLNPVVTLARDGTSSRALEKMGSQLVGGLVAGLFAAWYGNGLGDGCAVEAFSTKAAVGEALAAMLLARLYASAAKRDAQALGLSYVALLAVFGGLMGSAVNPALALGNVVGSGALSGNGFDMSSDGLLSLGCHLLAPLLGGLLAKPFFGAIDEGGAVASPIDKLSLGPLGSLDSGEFFGSFFLVTAFAAAGSDNALGRALALMALLWIYEKPSLLPTITAAKVLGRLPAGSDLAKLLTSLLMQTLGAALAILFATWLLGGAPDGPPGGSTRDTLIGGGLLGLVLSLGWLASNGASGPLMTGLTYFVAISTFSGPINPAYVLANALVNGGSFDGATLVAAVAPLIGGAGAGWLSSYFNK